MVAEKTILSSRQQNKSIFFRQEAPTWVWMVLSYCAFCYVFEGVYRWLLSLIGLNFLIYLRDPLALLLVAREFARFCCGYRVHVKSILLLITFCAVLFVSLLSIRNMFQVFFGAKIFIPCFLGYAYSRLFLKLTNSWEKLYLFLGLTVTFGVVLDNFINLPWEGLQINIAGREVMAGEERIYAGEDHVKRLTGFSNSAVNAAMCSIFFYVLYSTVSEKMSYKKILFWLITFITIILTTIKTLILATLVILLCDIARMLPSVWKKLVPFTVAVFTSLGVLLPVITIPLALTVKDPWKFRSSTTTFSSYFSTDSQALLFTSLVDRMQNTWPMALASLKSWVWGNGIGATGSAQCIFDAANCNLGSYCDNVFVYFYLIFGLFGVVLLAYALIQASRFKFSQHALVPNVAILIAVYGTMVNLENAYFMFFIGVVLNIAINPISRKEADQLHL
jgi:hypothetical protein